MPTEERFVDLSDAETAAALQRFVRRRYPGRGTLSVRHARPVVKRGRLTGLQAVGNQGMERVQIELTYAELTAALLAWCFSCGIPIPKRATKHTTMTGDVFSLVLTIDAPSPAAQAPPAPDPDAPAAS